MLQPFRHTNPKPYGPRAVLFLDPQEVLSRFVQGLVPGDALPFPLPPLSGPLQGMPEAVRVSEAVRRHPSFEAGVTLVQIPLRIAFYLNDLVSFTPTSRLQPPWSIRAQCVFTQRISSGIILLLSPLGLTFFTWLFIRILPLMSEKGKELFRKNGSI